MTEKRLNELLAKLKQRISALQERWCPRIKEFRERVTLRHVLLGVGLGCVVGGAVLVLVLIGIAATLPSVEDISKYRFLQPSIVYDVKGRVIAELGVERRYPVPIKDMPLSIRQAVVAVEDSRFYEHSGIDFVGIARAMLSNIKAGRFAEGGSTLTQQLVKNIYLSSDKKLIRKYKEAVLAYRLDKYLTKDEILEYYLNFVNFGRGGYGLQSAAINYFGKNAKDLTLPEAAMLAGIPKSPRIYSPHQSIERAKQRRAHVLYRMYEDGYITEPEYLAATDEPIVIIDNPPNRVRSSAYFLDYVLRFLTDELKIADPQNSGIIVHTTLDIDHQSEAERAMEKNLITAAKAIGYFGPAVTAKNVASATTVELVEGADASVVPLSAELIMRVPPYLERLGYKRARILAVEDQRLQIMVDDKTPGVIVLKDNRWAHIAPANNVSLNNFHSILAENDIIYVSPKKGSASEYLLEQDPPIEGALLSVNPQSGAILAMVGGFAFERSMFNRAWQAKRQVGSIFKPLVYSTALEHGMQAMDKMLDAPIIVSPDEKGRIWRPKNDEDKYFGETTLKEGLTRSRNIVTIRVAEKIGIGNILEYARRFGIVSELPADLSITIGSGTLSLMEMVYAYCTFPNLGTRPERPYFITKVEDIDGNVLFEAEVPSQVNVIRQETAQVMIDVLMNVVERGTGYRARAIPRPVGAKTGTTNENRDAWFVGFLPNLSVGVWMGFDDFSSPYSVGYGSPVSGPVWVDYVSAVLPRLPREVFPVAGSGVLYRKTDMSNWEATDDILPSEDISFEPYILR
ncbi:PBP1A family penicillin-binding protein [Deferribacterales bacterium RsTz2092]|nr:penicillin-binding protein [Deferribacterales bacterium]